MNLRDFFKSIAVLAVSPWKSLQSAWYKGPQLEGELVEVFPDHPDKYAGLIVTHESTEGQFRIIREFKSGDLWVNLKGETIYLNNDWRNKWFIQPLSGGQEFLGVIDARCDYLHGIPPYPYRFFKEV